MTSEEKRQRHKEGHRSRMEAARIAEARARRRHRFVVAGLVLVVAAALVAAAVVLLGGDDDETAATDDTTTTTAPEADPTLPDPPPGGTIEGPTPCPAEDGSEERIATFAEPPPTCIEEGQALAADITTSMGPITVALDAEAAPTMVNNFVVLARYHYFDGLPFHRLVPDFVAQTGSSGIPDYGSGGPGYDMPDIEKPSGAYAPGDVAMARSDAVSGSQFFLVASEAGAAQLTPEYPLFGRVTEGLDLVAELASLGDAATNGTPTEVVLVESVTIRPA
ncbi:peptidylprolyl isomerase [Iamia majanohamensis]|uniref:Peptidyl-prolyl cis-trans isomerase n=1 Tax=Iamia majanohamensis TaxID=467976 RepID=A0AAE9Y679_9ACTN|nr:peptidylprolyl isomerase [Iamia majanohamensis]WCO67399.1 peptidylprolyl isomerase [Iamia majanohamensis]